MHWPTGSQGSFRLFQSFWLGIVYVHGMVFNGLPTLPLLYDTQACTTACKDLWATGSIYESSAEPMSESQLCRSIKLPTDLEWELCVWVDSWHPSFRAPMMAAMVLISLLLAAVVFAALLSRHENRARPKLHCNLERTSDACGMLLKSGESLLVAVAHQAPTPTYPVQAGCHSGWEFSQHGIASS
ncbi:hypothetical protein HaLaN_29016 [Haematococcus lacustris]|uniref:Uncharacterized protein n=1 Tax=Haematococcus lacustris TaxID=44745 RepID=A0A6A0ABJ9_HAELA|nr:hypothetical protein HaLaN_29016 [Haematococcus lacustris]